MAIERLEEIVTEMAAGAGRVGLFAALLSRASAAEVMVAGFGQRDAHSDRARAWAVAAPDKASPGEYLRGNARFVHARFDAGAPEISCSMVGGSRVEGGACGAFQIETSSRLTDFSMRLNGPDLAAYTSCSGFAATVSADFVSAVRKVSVNGAATRWLRDGNKITFEVRDAGDITSEESAVAGRQAGQNGLKA